MPGLRGWPGGRKLAGSMPDAGHHAPLGKGRMQALRYGGAVAAALACLPAPGLAQDTLPWSMAGTWPVIVDPALGNGCFTYAAYDTGTVLRIGFNRLANQGYVMLTSNSWSSLQIGSEHDLRLIFGSAPPWDTVGTAVNLDGPTALWLSFVDVDVILDFMGQPNLQIWSDDRMVDSVSLAGSFDAFSEVMHCQGDMDAKSAPRA
jgi:hypothetical protein